MHLFSPVEAIPGVGPIMAAKLKEHGIATVLDALRTTPIRYVDFTDIKPIGSLPQNSWVVVRGTIASVVAERSVRKKMALIRALVSDDSGGMEVLWFNQSYLTRMLRNGMIVHLYGYVTWDHNHRLVLRSPQIYTGANAAIESHYSERYGVSDGHFRRLIRAVLPVSSELIDPLPAEILQKYEIISLPQAVLQSHHPKTMAEAWQARFRFAVDELWTVMTVGRMAKQLRSTQQAPEIQVNAAKQVKLPFILTKGQQEALKQIEADFAKRMPMRRLLNGDVGSGKTIVSFLAAKMVLDSGLAAVMMVPTTVLAAQHYKSWQKLYPDTNYAMVTSGNYLWNGEKVTQVQLLKLLKENKSIFICGTQAIFHLDASFKVGLVIVDEQHRFGVMQRSLLLAPKEGPAPHLLSLSATPIPRTAALALYGDLDMSVLPEKPVGRKRVETRLMSDKSREMMYKFIDQLLEKGQQAYVICPLIAPSEDADEGTGQFMFTEEKKTVKEEVERLQKTVFAHRRIVLLHGKMKQAEKDAVLTQFYGHEIDILVSTTVIEVGIDVANATVMLIEGAECFGLAQLHQLRGRVGRSDVQSYCFLCPSMWSENIKQRLDLVVSTDDGFTLAEKDLELRGPGELYGTLQAGITPFHYATLSDGAMVATAQKIATDLFSRDSSSWSDQLKDWVKDHQQTVHSE